MNLLIYVLLALISTHPAKSVDHNFFYFHRTNNPSILTSADSQPQIPHSDVLRTNYQRLQTRADELPTTVPGSSIPVNSVEPTLSPVAQPNGIHSVFSAAHLPPTNYYYNTYAGGPLALPPRSPAGNYDGIVAQQQFTMFHSPQILLPPSVPKGTHVVNPHLPAIPIEQLFKPSTISDVHGYFEVRQPSVSGFAYSIGSNDKIVATSSFTLGSAKNDPSFSRFKFLGQRPLENYENPYSSLLLQEKFNKQFGKNIPDKVADQKLKDSLKTKEKSVDYKEIKEAEERLSNIALMFIPAELEDAPSVEQEIPVKTTEQLQVQPIVDFYIPEMEDIVPNVEIEKAKDIPKNRLPAVPESNIPELEEGIVPTVGIEKKTEEKVLGVAPDSATTNNGIEQVTGKPHSEVETPIFVEAKIPTPVMEKVTEDNLPAYEDVMIPYVMEDIVPNVGIETSAEEKVPSATLIESKIPDIQDETATVVRESEPSTEEEKTPTVSDTIIPEVKEYIVKEYIAPSVEIESVVEEQPPAILENVAPTVVEISTVESVPAKTAEKIPGTVEDYTPLAEDTSATAEKSPTTTVNIPEISEESVRNVGGETFVEDKPVQLDDTIIPDDTPDIASNVGTEKSSKEIAIPKIVEEVLVPNVFDDTKATPRKVAPEIVKDIVPNVGFEQFLEPQDEKVTPEIISRNIPPTTNAKYTTEKTPETIKPWIASHSASFLDFQAIRPNSGRIRGFASIKPKEPELPKPMGEPVHGIIITGATDFPVPVNVEEKEERIVQVDLADKPISEPIQSNVEDSNLLPEPAQNFPDGDKITGEEKDSEVLSKELKQEEIEMLQGISLMGSIPDDAYEVEERSYNPKTQNSFQSIQDTAVKTTPTPIILETTSTPSDPFVYEVSLTAPNNFTNQDEVESKDPYLEIVQTPQITTPQTTTPQPTTPQITTPRTISQISQEVPSYRYGTVQSRYLPIPDVKALKLLHTERVRKVEEMKALRRKNELQKLLTTTAATTTTTTTTESTTTTVPPRLKKFGSNKRLRLTPTTTTTTTTEPPLKRNGSTKRPRVRVVVKTKVRNQMNKTLTGRASPTIR